MSGASSVIGILPLVNIFITREISSKHTRKRNSTYAAQRQPQVDKWLFSWSLFHYKILSLYHVFQPAENIQKNIKTILRTDKTHSHFNSFKMFKSLYKVTYSHHQCSLAIWNDLFICMFCIISYWRGYLQGGRGEGKGVMQRNQNVLIVPVGISNRNGMAVYNVPFKLFWSPENYTTSFLQTYILRPEMNFFHHLKFLIHSFI